MPLAPSNTTTLIGGGPDVRESPRKIVATEARVADDAGEEREDGVEDETEADAEGLYERSGRWQMFVWRKGSCQKEGFRAKQSEILRVGSERGSEG
eukprot:754191-Hanusia_phi.AAC.16